MIENPMVTGYSVPPEREDEPDYICPRCKGAIYVEDDVFEWEDGWICEDCFTDAALSLDPGELAELMGVTRMSVEDIV